MYDLGGAANSASLLLLPLFHAPCWASTRWTHEPDASTASKDICRLPLALQTLRRWRHWRCGWTRATSAGGTLTCCSRRWPCRQPCSTRTGAACPFLKILPCSDRHGERRRRGRMRNGSVWDAFVSDLSCQSALIVLWSVRWCFSRAPRRCTKNHFYHRSRGGSWTLIPYDMKARASFCLFQQASSSTQPMRRRSVAGRLQQRSRAAVVSVLSH